MENHIRLISQRLRWIVLSLSIIAFCYVVVNYMLYEKVVFNSNHPVFIELWRDYSQAHTQLLIGQLPSFFLGLSMVYWVWKLFGHYANGEFFGVKSNRCYLWLVWIYGLGIPVSMLHSIWLAYLSSELQNTFSLMLEVDLSKLFTLFVLISIVYILRAAMHIEQENKEFV
ncbi:MAG: hypothetical protein AAGB12_14135 [Pseudomonadota bacterium]